MLKHLLWLLILVLSSCRESYLTVKTDYLSHESLASYYVNTPDPRLNNPSIGQRLIISWIVPKGFREYKDLHLEVTIRFRTREELVEKVSIKRPQGTWVYALYNNDYIATNGILTFKVDLVADGCILEEWRHQIWTELISVSQDEKPGECPQEPAEDIFDLS